MTDATRMADRLLATVQWEPQSPPADTSGLPYPTHAGVLDLGGHRFRVYQLSTGQRIIDAEDLERFFGCEDRVES